MIVYFHSDAVGNITTYAFKTKISAAEYMIARIPELGRYARKRNIDGTYISIISKEIMEALNLLVSSALKDDNACISILQKALDLYEECIGGTAVCHTIRIIKVVA